MSRLEVGPAMLGKRRPRTPTIPSGTYSGKGKGPKEVDICRTSRARAIGTTALGYLALGMERVWPAMGKERVKDLTLKDEQEDKKEKEKERRAQKERVERRRCNATGAEALVT